MIPTTVDIGEHWKDDTWPGIASIGPITDALLAPAFATTVVKAEMFFRVAGQDGVAAKLASDVSAPGQITITDAATWEFVVPPQPLALDAGDYEWSFRTTDSANVIRTLYIGTFVVRSRG